MHCKTLEIKLIILIKGIALKFMLGCCVYALLLGKTLIII